MTAADPPPVFVLTVRPTGSKSGGDVSPIRLFPLGTRSPETSPGTPMTALMSYRRPLVLIHGFNDSLADAIGLYGEMTGNLAKAGLFAGGRGPDVIIHFHWPGDVYASILKIIGYAEDLKQCFQSASALADFWRQLPTGAPRTVSFITHSMGGRIVLEMLRGLADPHSPPLDPLTEFGVVALMAPAVPTNLAEPGEYLAGTDAPPRHVLKYFSSDDVVLSSAFPAGQAEATLLGIDGGPYGEAIGSHGMPATFGSYTKDWQCEHWQYWPNADVAADIAAVLVATCRPDPASARPMAKRSLPPVSALKARQI